MGLGRPPILRGSNPNPTPLEKKIGKVARKVIRYGAIPLDPRGALTRAATRLVTKPIIRKLKGRMARKAGKPLARGAPKRKTPTR